MRCRDARTGERRALTVEVPPDGGVVHSSVGDTKLALAAEDVSRLRQVFLEALAVALQDRGGF